MITQQIIHIEKDNIVFSILKLDTFTLYNSHFLPLSFSPLVFLCVSLLIHSLQKISYMYNVKVTKVYQTKYTCIFPKYNYANQNKKTFSLIRSRCKDHCAFFIILYFLFCQISYQRTVVLSACSRQFGFLHQIKNN